VTEEDEIKFSLCPHVDIQTTDNLSLQTINLLRREKNRSNLDFVIGVVLVSCHGPFLLIHIPFLKSSPYDQFKLLQL